MIDLIGISFIPVYFVVGPVPDLGSRDRNVVLVRRTIDLGCWEFGMGREWGRDGEVSSRATWGQGGQDRITPKEGFQVIKREMEGGTTKNQQGE
jgi:hypothetical protein